MRGMTLADWRAEVDRVLRDLPTCAGCGVKFDAVRPGQRHCRPSCAALADERRRGARLPMGEQGSGQAADGSSAMLKGRS